MKLSKDKEIHRYSNKNLAGISPLLYDLQTYFLQVNTLASLPKTDKPDLDTIKVLSKHALQMIDYALLSIDTMQGQLALENVSASALTQEVAGSLYSLAKAYNVELDVDITKKLEPIYTNKLAAKGILYGLATSLITKARESSSAKHRPQIILAAQETTPKTQRLGIYSPNLNISPSIIKSTQKLILSARSIAPSDFNHSGLGLMVSDNLSRHIGNGLQRFKHRGNKGVGFYVPLSSQLSFV